MANAEAGFPAEILVGAVCETLETMAGLSVEVGDPPSEDEIRFECGQITGAMNLAGAKNGLLLIGADRNSAAELVMYMTGIETTELPENDLHDGIMELVNMVAGVVRKKVAGSAWEFHLSSPWAIVGEGIRVITKRRVESYSARFTAGTIQLTIKIIYV